MSKEYIYVASPYSHSDPEVREYRYQLVHPNNNFT